MTNDISSKLPQSSTTTKPRPWIQTGRYEFETVCRTSLCPKEWLQAEKIYVCECCLKNTIQATAARRHRVGLSPFFFVFSSFFILSFVDQMYGITSTRLFNLPTERC